MEPSPRPELPARSPLPLGRIVAIGGSAGGIRAAVEILSLLPADFPLPILFVLHLSALLPSRLVEVLAFKTKLRVKWAQWGERALPGTVHVAPPDRHLLLEPNGRLALSDSDRVNYWRPAVDRLFESVAAVSGGGSIGVVLSGSMFDGMRGIAAIRDAGGLTIAQSEMSSDHFEMPCAAIDQSRADIVLSPAKIAEALIVASEVDFAA
jgi:two-component system chemotaxis response regulator CheB